MMRSDDMRRLAIVVGLTLLLAGLTQAAGVFNRADGDYLSIATSGENQDHDAT